MNLDAVVAYQIPAVEQLYTAKDTILYALGLGYGDSPTEPGSLKFLYEKDLVALPSMCVVLGYAGPWYRDPAFAIDWVKLVHAEQRFTVHAPIPAAGRVRAHWRVVAVEDKGAAKGAIVHTEKKLVDATTGTLLADVTQALFLRGDGGVGGFGTPPAPLAALPDRVGERVVEIATLPQSALIYRLSGDFNPLHADPAVARAAGYPRPILHGLCTLGIACRALLRASAADDPGRLRSVAARFSKPLFPGETVRVEILGSGGVLGFRALALPRGELVLDRGRAEVSG